MNAPCANYSNNSRSTLRFLFPNGKRPTSRVVERVVTSPSVSDLLDEYERALTYTNDLWTDLTLDEVRWRADENSSAIGWHLGHQPAVAHFMVRNLTAAEPSLDPALDTLMDSATPPPGRAELPNLERLTRYREGVAERVRVRLRDIDTGNVGAPAQLRVIATTLLVAVINHEYQHSKWISEVRSEVHGRSLPAVPTSRLLSVIDGYNVISVD